MRIFSVGNSYAQDAHCFLPEIAAGADIDLDLLNAMIGGCSLERHVRHANAYDKNKDDPEGSPYPIGFSMSCCKISLRQCLQLKPWDIVTIQQASHYSFFPDTYHPYAEQLIAYIRRWAPCAEIVIHETWAYRDDHSFDRDEWNGMPVNTDIMFKGLKKCYHDLAKKTGFRLIPTGEALQRARLSKGWGKPVLPDPEPIGTAPYSLHGRDRLHLNETGRYLAGLVWAEKLLGLDARTIKLCPTSITEEEAKTLRAIAHRTVHTAKA